MPARLKFLSLKAKIRIADLKHDYLLNSPKLKSPDKDDFKKIINLKGDREDYENSLENLLIFLYRHYGKPAVILIDEYDAPVHEGYDHDFYDDIINFMRNFLGGALKDTDQYLEKSIISGIMRIAKESIFSDLNNPGVYTLLSEEFDDKFGFTEKEVETLPSDYQLLDMYDQVQLWYNGYRFGERIIYNPWSIINFLGSKGKKLRPYWINTSDNKIVESLLSKGGKELKEELELLIRGETIEKTIDENIMLKALIDGDISLFEKMLRKIVTAVFSYHDFSGEPEKVYHALVTGLLVWISNTHEIRSNRESGYGRYDIMILPHDPGQTGYVIEFTAVDPEDNETVPQAVAAALRQIEEKKYETELIERGIEKIKKLAVVFSGKEVYVKENKK